MSMTEREDDRTTAGYTLASILDKIEYISTKIDSLDLIAYQRDLDTVDAALRGVVRDHRKAQREA